MGIGKRTHTRLLGWLTAGGTAAEMAFPTALPADLTADGWRLRALSDEDWRLEWTMSRDPEVVRWTLYPPHLTEESARERIRRTRQRAEEQRAARYAVLDHDGIAIGIAGIACSETSSREAEVFYALLPHGRHRGAATAAARALSDWALSIGIERVLLVTILANNASKAVARRAGFALEGEETRDLRGAPTLMLRWSRYVAPEAEFVKIRGAN
jgi:RimJ/RimL family protein N-acetyltransferase